MNCLVLVGIDPGVYHLGSDIVSHNTIDARQSHSTRPSTIFTGVPQGSVRGLLCFHCTQACGKYEYSKGLFPICTTFISNHAGWLTCSARRPDYVRSRHFEEPRGLSGPSLWEVTWATFITRLTVRFLTSTCLNRQQEWACITYTTYNEQEVTTCK